MTIPQHHPKEPLRDVPRHADRLCERSSLRQERLFPRLIEERQTERSFLLEERGHDRSTFRHELQERVIKLVEGGAARRDLRR